MSEAQLALLTSLSDGKIRELFAPNTGTLRNLRNRGLISCQFIGMRYWKAAITRAGRAALSGGHDG